MVIILKAFTDASTILLQKLKFKIKQVDVSNKSNKYSFSKEHTILKTYLIKHYKLSIPTHWIA